jgi:hypothetical protein
VSSICPSFFAGQFNRIAVKADCASLTEKIVDETHAPWPGRISDRQYVVCSIERYKSRVFYSRCKLLSLRIGHTDVVPAVDDQRRSVNLRENSADIDIAMRQEDFGGVSG